MFEFTYRPDGALANSNKIIFAATDISPRWGGLNEIEK